MKVGSEKEPFRLPGGLRDPVSALYHRPTHRFRDEAGPDRTAPSSLQAHWRFLLAAFTRHAQTGAIVPSQRFLIDRMIAPVPVAYAGQVVELGPGTGALTMRLAARCRAADILACEINPDLAQVVRERVAADGLKDRVKVVSAAAEHVLSALTRDRTRPRPEFIISGIPLGNLPRDSAVALIELIHKTLVPGGLYIQFQYSLLDRKKIKTRFSRMRTVPVLLNIPPAVVYYARK